MKAVHSKYYIVTYSINIVLAEFFSKLLAMWMECFPQNEGKSEEEALRLICTDIRAALHSCIALVMDAIEFRI